MQTLFRVETTKYKTDDIIECDFEKGIFRSNVGTYTFNDINAFIVPCEKMKELLKINTEPQIIE